MRYRTMNERMGQTIKEVATAAAMVAIVLIPFAAWITHIVYCIQVEKFLLLIAGAVFFPIGMLHGFGLWFGIF